jgi:hypothetical protein
MIAAFMISLLRDGAVRLVPFIAYLTVLDII